MEEAGAELLDLVWVQESYSVKVLRDGNYPTFLGIMGLLHLSAVAVLAAGPVAYPV